MNAPRFLLLLPVFFAFSSICTMVHGADDLPAGDSWDWPSQRELTATQQATLDERLAEVRQLLEKRRAAEEELRKAEEQFEPTRQRIAEANEQIDALENAVNSLSTYASLMETAKKKEEKEEAARSLASARASIPDLVKAVRGVGQREVDNYIEYLLNRQRLQNQLMKAQKDVGKAKTDEQRTTRQAALVQRQNAIAQFEEERKNQDVKEKFEDALNKARAQVDRQGSGQMGKINEIRMQVMEVGGELRGLHGQIGQLKGYDMGFVGVEAIDLAAIMEGTNIPGLAWLDFEISYIERLGESGYDDLAARYLELLRRSNHPESNQPLNDQQKNHLNKVAASLMMQQAFRTRDLAEKMTYAKEAVELSKKIPELQVPDTLLYYDAIIDLARTYFRLADHLADAASRELRVAGVERPAPPPRPAVDPVAKPAPTNEQGEEEEWIDDEEEQAHLHEWLRPGERVAVHARHRPGATGGAAGATPVRGMVVDGSASARRVVSAVPVSGSLVDAGAASRLVLSPTADGTLGLQTLALAQEFYTQGMDVAAPVQQSIKQTFELLVDEYIDMIEEGQKQQANDTYLPALDAYGGRMVRIQHAMEDAYASWPSVYPVGSDKRLEIAEKGNTFTAANVGDYQAYWPTDKLGYVYWIGVMGNLVDPVIEWSGDEAERVSPPPSEDYYDLSDPLDKADYELEKNNPNRWRWPSDRIHRIWEANIIEGRENVEHPDANVQSQRIRALYYYGQANANLAMTHRVLADRDKSPKMVAHAEMLHERAMQALNEGIKVNSVVGEVDETTRYNVRLKLRIDYFLFLAEQAKAGGDQSEAGKWVMQAIAEAASVQSEGSANWRVTAEQYMAGVVAAQARLGIHVDESDIPPSVMITQADSLLADSRGIRNPREKRAVLNEAIAKYIEGIGALRGERERGARDAVLPKALFNLGIAAIQTEDYLLGYIANWELVQEFHDKFKDPSRRYPPDRFSNSATYLPRAMRHLQYAAFHYNRSRQDPLSQGMYADALIRIAELKDSADAGEEYVQLIDLLKRMKEYERAVHFIDNVPGDNLYHNLVQLMAADIWQTMMRSSIRERERIDARLNPAPDEDGNIPEELILSDEERAALQTKREAVQARIQECRDQAMAYSEKFIRLHQEARARWEAEAYPPPDNIQRVRDQERRNLLQAMLIPIALDINEENWESAYERSNEYIEAVKTQEGVSEEHRREFLAQGNWLRFISILRQADFQEDPIEEALKVLDRAAKEQVMLGEADQERKYLSDSSMMMGGSYMRLAGRIKKTIEARLEDGATETDVAPLSAQEDELRLAAVNQFLKAEEALYQKGNAGLGINMIRTLGDQELYEQAEQVGRNVIAFWSESMFTPVSLFRNATVNAARVAEMGIPEEMQASAGPLFPGVVAAARQGDEALLGALNELVQTFNPLEHADAITTLIQQARLREEGKQSHLQNRDHLRGLDQADEILARLQRGDETPNEVRYRLNRLVLEAVFADALYQAPYKPLIPSVEQLNEMVQRIERAYTTRDAQRKAAVLSAMINPETIRGRRAQALVDGNPGPDGTRQGGFLADLRNEIEATEDEEERARLQRLERNFTEPLSLLIFGERNARTGRIEKRNFNRAAENIAILLDWDQKENVGVDLPIRSELREIRDALLFENTMVFAKLGYARAMVEVGKFIEAKAYLEELSDFFPTMASIRIDLARAYTAMGAYEIQDGKVVPRPYGAEAAKNFMQGRYLINEVLNIYRSAESSIHWDAWGQFFENGVREIKSRKASGPAGEQVYQIEIAVFNPKTGQDQVYKPTTTELDKQATELVTDLARKVASNTPDSFIDLADSLLNDLRTMGYEPPDVTSTEELVFDDPEPAPKKEEEGEGGAGDAGNTGDAGAGDGEGSAAVEPVDPAAPAPVTEEEPASSDAEPETVE